MRKYIILIAFILLYSCNQKEHINSKIHKTDSIKHNKEKVTLQKNSIINQLKDSINEVESLANDDREFANKFLQDSINEFLTFKPILSSDCNEWNYPNKIELKAIIQNMKWQYGSDIHYLFSHYPCQIEGVLKTKNGNIFNYSLNAAGYIAIQNDNKSFYLGCENLSFKKYFFDIKLPLEEIEKVDK